MRLGLLLCDHVRPEFQSIGGDYPDFFGRLLDGIELCTFDLTNGDFPEGPDACEAWISSGSRHSVYDDIKWIHRFAGFVRRLDIEERRYIGVCFGAQMIAHALGGKVAPAPQGWQVGIKRAEMVDGGWLRILHSNADQIVEMSPQMRLIASSITNPIEMVAIGDHFLGIQGHPEFTTEYAVALMESRRGSLIPTDVVDAALTSMDVPPDEDRLRDLIVNFLNGSVVR